MGDRYRQGSVDAAAQLQRLAGDPRLAGVFQQIRAILAVNEMDMARMLGTGVDVVLCFESGAVDGLPAWPETARLIERYAELGGVDPAPLLGRVLSLQTLPTVPPPRPRMAPAASSQLPAPPARAELARPIVPVASDISPPLPLPSPHAAGLQQVSTHAASLHRHAESAARAPITVQSTLPPKIEPAEPPIGFTARSKPRAIAADVNAPRTRPPLAAELSDAERSAVSARRRRRTIRTVIAASPVFALFVMFATLQIAPRPVYAVAEMVPGLRGIIDTMSLQTATYRDGMRWIDAGDPRMRKSNRLN